MFGLCIGFANSLRAVIYVENFGLENLTNVYGLVSVAIGLGAMFGPLVAAFLKDWTESYMATFIFGGIGLIISSIAMLLTPIVRKREFK